jgi:hypothetical protein
MPTAPDDAHDRTPAEQHAAMRWAQRLKCVFRPIVIAHSDAS